jgi:predicted RNase H-like nuclease (RuvC/YqgF family)
VNRPLIVGFDPGTTAGLAIIDTKGEILFIKSKRGFKKSEIIEEITSRGKPLIISGDRCPLPKSVEKLASTLGCRSYYPIKSLTNFEKTELVKEFEERLENDHEKDALASALKAFQSYSRLFRRTEKTLSSLGMSELYERVVKMVITGKAENINEAINRILTESREVKPVVVKKVVEKRDEAVVKLQEKIRGLEKDIVILKKHNEALKNKLRKREEKMDLDRKRISDSSVIRRLNRDIKKLKDDIRERGLIKEKLKSLRRIELEGYIPILELNEVREEPIRSLHRRLDLRDRVLLAHIFENAQILNDYEIKALIVPYEPKERILEKVNFPILVKKDILIEKFKDISAVKKREFEEKLSMARKVGFVQWLKGHKERKL